MMNQGLLVPTATPNWWKTSNKTIFKWYGLWCSCALTLLIAQKSTALQNVSYPRSHVCSWWWFVMLLWYCLWCLYVRGRGKAPVTCRCSSGRLLSLQPFLILGVCNEHCSLGLKTCVSCGPKNSDSNQHISEPSQLPAQFDNPQEFAAE